MTAARMPLFFADILQNFPTWLLMFRSISWMAEQPYVPVSFALVCLLPYTLPDTHAALSLVLTKSIMPPSTATSADVTFGNLLKQLRRRASMTQADLGVI